MNDLNDNILGLLQPILSSLSATLPAPVYSVLINGLSHCLALFTAVCNLAITLFSLRWDAQTLLPPLITLFAAYLALLSFYRTTTWMLRTSVFVIKWGTMIGALVAGAGWVMNNGRGNPNGVTSFDIASNVRNILYGWIVGEDKVADGTRSRSSHTRRSPKQRPKPWDSFEQHRKSKHQEKSRGGDSTDALKIINDIWNGVGKVAKEANWWTAVGNIVQGSSGSKSGPRDEQLSRNSKTKAGKSRSR